MLYPFEMFAIQREGMNGKALVMRVLAADSVDVCLGYADAERMLIGTVYFVLRLDVIKGRHHHATSKIV